MFAVVMPASSVLGLDWMLLAVVFLLALVFIPQRVERWRIVCAVLVVGAVMTGRAFAFPALHPCFGIDPDSWTYFWLGCGWFS